MLVSTELAEFAVSVLLSRPPLAVDDIVVIPACPAPTFGQIGAMPLPLNMFPMRLFGSAMLPVQTVFMHLKAVLRAATHPSEHGAPSLKSDALQPVTGSL